MSEEKKISVIVPAYQVEKHLAKCVDSIINQTYRNLEIILVDDGSTDRCPSICDEYSNADSRVKVIHQSNRGLSAARNSGIDIATGDLLAFIDADDYIDSRMFEILQNRMDESDADMVIGNYVFISEEESIDMSKCCNLRSEVLTPEETLDRLQTYYNYMYVPACNKLYRKELWETIRFPEGKLHEDQFVVHELINKCRRIATASDVVYFYVQHGSGIMSSISVRRLDEIEAMMSRYDFYKSLHYDDKANLLMEQIALRYKNLMPLIKEDKRKKEIADEFNKRYFAIPSNDTLYKHIRCRYLGLFGKLRKLYDKIIALREYVLAKLRGVGRKYVILDTPIHGNLGDQAIVIAMKDMVNNAYEITANSFELMGKLAKRSISRDTIILIPGGGSLGILWPLEEDRFRRILKSFPDNRIIVFPQTVTFDMESVAGRIIAEESRKIYSAHKFLTLFVRENRSLNYMNSTMPDVNCKLAPDVVMAYNFKTVSMNREGIICCLRKDVESVYSHDDIISEIKRNYPTMALSEIDNVTDEFDYRNRKYYVDSQLKRFASAKLVVTDRLHGMLFALITGTPCIVFDNANSKVSEVYKSIPQADYIKFCDDIADVNHIAEQLNIHAAYSYNRELIVEKYEVIKEHIQ